LVRDSSLALLQLMAVCGLEGEAIDFSKLFDLLQGRGRKGRVALKGVQHDSLQQIAEREVFQLGQSLEYLEQAFFHADAGLNPVDNDGSRLLFHGNNVPKYHNNTIWGDLESATQSHFAVPILKEVVPGLCRP